MARLLKKYNNEIIPILMGELGYKNTMQVPRLEKIVVSMGLGEATQNSKVIDFAMTDMTKITGQKPIPTRARKSIAGFKLRAGVIIGCKVTLRGRRMYEFFDRLVNVALPRVRDFKGVSPKAFDGRGSFAMGLREQVVFPEIDYDGIDKIRGLNVVIVTTAETDKEAEALLRHLGMPFSRR